MLPRYVNPWFGDIEDKYADRNCLLIVYSFAQVSRLTLEELNQFVKFLERVYFQFEPVEGLEFITNKLKRMTANERCREAPSSKRFPSVNTVLDKIPTIRQASPQSPSYTLVQLALCHLSWSSMKYTILVRFIVYASKPVNARLIILLLQLEHFLSR